MCIGVPSHLPLANSRRAPSFDHSRIMSTSLFTLGSCIKIIQTSFRLRRHLAQAALFVSSEFQRITKPLHPASLRSCFLGQLLMASPMYRRILQQTWYRLPLPHTQRLRHRILPTQMRLWLPTLLSLIWHRSPDAGEEKTAHSLRIRGSCSCCGYIVRRYSRSKLSN